jgi:hypothetical protein
VVHGPPAGEGGIRFEPKSRAASVGWGWDSGVGGHVVVSLHARVSDHVSGPRCSSLTAGI